MLTFIKVQKSAPNREVTVPSTYLTGPGTAHVCYRVAEKHTPSACIFLNKDLTVKPQRRYTFTNHSPTSLLPAYNRTFPFENIVIRKHLIILISNMCNSPLMNNLKTEKNILKNKKIYDTLLPTVDGISHEH